MIDWEEIIRTESTEELKEAKLWLFQENMRLQQERTELEQAKDKFLEERVTLRDELDALNRRTVIINPTVKIRSAANIANAVNLRLLELVMITGAAFHTGITP